MFLLINYIYKRTYSLAGVGKGTIIDTLLKQYPSSLGLSVSHTTRKPRVNEVEGSYLSTFLPTFLLTQWFIGVHYYYVNHEIITDLIEKKLFVEYAKVHGNIYGTSLQAVKRVQDEGSIFIYSLVNSIKY